LLGEWRLNADCIDPITMLQSEPKLPNTKNSSKHSLCSTGHFDRTGYTCPKVLGLVIPVRRTCVESPLLPLPHFNPKLRGDYSMPDPHTATPYRAKLFMDKGESYFTMVHCPACKVEFRLLWPVTLLSYPKDAVLSLRCPECRAQFNSKQPEAKLCHIARACEGFPAAPVESIEQRAMKAGR
jgi:hypothetical protein